MNNQPKDKCIDCGGKGVVIYKKGEHPDKGTENKYTCLSCKGTGEGETMEEKIKEILGLEVSPAGEPNFFLISDSEGNVEEGIDFSDEVKQISELIALALQEQREEVKELIKEWIEKGFSLETLLDNVDIIPLKKELKNLE